MTRYVSGIRPQRTPRAVNGAPDAKVRARQEAASLRQAVATLKSAVKRGPSETGFLNAAEFTSAADALGETSLNVDYFEVRPALLAGLPARFAASLPRFSAPGDQLRADLTSLDGVVRPPDGWGGPLATFAANLEKAAKKLSAKREVPAANLSALTPEQVAQVRKGLALLQAAVSRGPSGAASGSSSYLSSTEFFAVRDCLAALGPVYARLRKPLTEGLTRRFLGSAPVMSESRDQLLSDLAVFNRVVQPPPFWPAWRGTSVPLGVFAANLEALLGAT